MTLESPLYRLAPSRARQSSPGDSAKPLALPWVWTPVRRGAGILKARRCRAPLSPSRLSWWDRRSPRAFLRLERGLCTWLTASAQEYRARHQPDWPLVDHAWVDWKP